MATMPSHRVCGHTWRVKHSLALVTQRLHDVAVANPNADADADADGNSETIQTRRPVLVTTQS